MRWRHRKVPHDAIDARLAGRRLAGIGPNEIHRAQSRTLQRRARSTHSFDAGGLAREGVFESQAVTVRTPARLPALEEIIQRENRLNLGSCVHHDLFIPFVFSPLERFRSPLESGKQRVQRIRPLRPLMKASIFIPNFKPPNASKPLAVIMVAGTASRTSSCRRGSHS